MKIKKNKIGLRVGRRKNQKNILPTVQFMHVDSSQDAYGCSAIAYVFCLRNYCARFAKQFQQRLECFSLHSNECKFIQ